MTFNFKVQRLQMLCRLHDTLLKIKVLYWYSGSMKNNGTFSFHKRFSIVEKGSTIKCFLHQEKKRIF